MLPKFLGGLSIKLLDIMNYDSLLKLCWAIQSNGQSICCEVIHGKYIRNDAGFDDVIVKANDSGLWKNFSLFQYNSS